MKKQKPYPLKRADMASAVVYSSKGLLLIFLYGMKLDEIEYRMCKSGYNP